MSETTTVTYKVRTNLDMEEDRRKSSKRPLIIVIIVFLILTIIVGVVTWKLTKDAYDVPCGATSLSVSNDNVNEAPNPSTTGVPSISKIGYPKTPKTETPYPSTTGTPEESPTTGATNSPTTDEQPWTSLRMRRDVLPVHYDITMFPDFYGDAGEFYGNETIELEVYRPTRHILIHIHPDYIKVTRSSVTDKASNKELNITRTFVYRENEFFVIELNDVITSRSSVLLKLQFEGSLTKGIVGIYKSTYYNTATNQTQSLSSSKFEPTFARRAFPCFDEPNIKAYYTITLIHRKEFIALSNMPQDGESEPVSWSTDLVSTKFQRSVKMSTYLVCFTVCDFEYLTTNSSRGIPIRVFASPDKINQAQYALQVAKTSLDLYENLFKENYPLPKQDLIAIPDFVSGAMEHWGLISFRESRMLFDEDKSTLAAAEGVAHVVSHEMAHMWFGNLVTMDWWNDLWLNEGFASYMEYLGAEKHEPAWDMMTKFLINDMYAVMDQDSAISSHPIIVDVQNPNQITSVFDAISYSKGASVIRMLETIMGKEKFFAGVAKYLKEHKWGNAKTDDLWRALSETDTDHDVKSIMDTWTLQDGLPYVTLTISTDTDGVNTVNATQKRFLLNKDTQFDTSDSPLGYKWYIQLDYMTSNGQNGSVVMNMTDVSFSERLGLGDANSWIKVNLDQNHFYRVLYPDTMWTAFSNYLQQTPYENWTLSTADRAGLLADAFKLASAGLVKYDVPLGLTAYLGKEKDYVPWMIALSQGIDYISTMLHNDPDFDLWKSFLGNQSTPVLKRLGMSDVGGHLDRQLRARLLRVACDVGDTDTVSSLNEFFQVWIDYNVADQINFRPVIYQCGMASNGTEKDWDIVWNRYLVESSPTEKVQLYRALASTKNPVLVRRLLDKAKSEDGIKRQDFFSVIIALGNNQDANPIVWDWAKQNYQAFIDRFTLNDRYFGRMIYYLVRDYNTEGQLKEVEDFFKLYPEAGTSERYRRMALERIETNIQWMNNYKPQIVQWLREKAATSTA